LKDIMNNSCNLEIYASFSKLSMWESTSLIFEVEVTTFFQVWWYHEHNL
jgi:hypothetical protein